MRLEVGNRVYELPPPDTAPGETVVRVKSYCPFAVPAAARAHRFAFENQIAKLLYFAWREGVTLTLGKVRSAFLQRAIGRERQVVFAVGELPETGEPVIAIGPQDAPRAEVQRFPERLVAPLGDGAETAALYRRAAAFFDARPSALSDLFLYSPHSGQPLTLGLEEIVGAADPGRAGAPGFRAIAFDGGRPVLKPTAAAGQGQPELFLIGAGAYACAYILPALSGTRFDTVVDLNPALAATVGHRFGFRHWETATRRAFERLRAAENPIVVIAGYHSTHADHAAQAIAANPGARVFVEKPPALTMAQAETLVALRGAGAHVEIGYNRRSAGLFAAAMEKVSAETGPLCVTCIVKELKIPESHWYYWPSQGTRILGNVGHWVDIGVGLIGAEPTAIVVASAKDGIVGDEVSLTVMFGDGSRLTIVATKAGNGLRGVQEYVDIRRGDLTVRIDDFVSMTTEHGGRRRTRRRRIRDKGHRRMYRAFLDDIAAGRRPRYPDRDILATTRILTAAVDAVRRGAIGCVIELEAVNRDG